MEYLVTLVKAEAKVKVVAWFLGTDFSRANVVATGQEAPSKFIHNIYISIYISVFGTSHRGT